MVRLWIYYYSKLKLSMYSSIWEIMLNKMFIQLFLLFLWNDYSWKCLVSYCWFIKERLFLKHSASRALLGKNSSSFQRTNTENRSSANTFCIAFSYIFSTWNPYAYHIIYQTYTGTRVKPSHSIMVFHWCYMLYLKMSSMTYYFLSGKLKTH